MHGSIQATGTLTAGVPKPPHLDLIKTAANLVIVTVSSWVTSIQQTGTSAHQDALTFEACQQGVVHLEIFNPTSADVQIDRLDWYVLDEGGWIEQPRWAIRGSQHGGDFRISKRSSLQARASPMNIPGSWASADSSSL